MNFDAFTPDCQVEGGQSTARFVSGRHDPIKQPADDMAILLDSNLLDPVWYKQTYPGVSGSHADVVRHYLHHGALDGHDPHPLFDSKYYLDQCPDVAAHGINPLVHYLMYGGRERRNPHPLFDTKFYLALDQIFERQITNPLAHFCERGLKEKLDPNPFFDTSWYLATNADVARSGMNPLVHYVTIGEKRGSNPSQAFDIDWYLRCNLDVAHTKSSPFYHFLRSGQREGREPCRASSVMGVVTDTEIYCLKEPSRIDEISLFVTHSPDGHLKPHVCHYLDSLQRSGISPTLIVATDAPFLDADMAGIQNLNGLFVRGNEGYDFAAWAHVLRRHPEMFDAKVVYLINDSLIGPVDEVAFQSMMARLRSSSADLVGLTDSYESCWHIQSYFLTFKNGALSTPAFRQFIDSIVSFRQKMSVVAEYETRLASIFEAAGLRCEVLFPQQLRFPINRTLFHWKALIQAGFPFVKVSTIRDESAKVDIADWQEFLTSHGYDVSLAERAFVKLRLPKGGNAPATTPPIAAASSALLVPAMDEAGFDPEFYTTVYPDIAATGTDPLEHFTNYGRAEGRLSRMPAQFDTLRQLATTANDRETVLIVSHEGVRGGAPILAYTLMMGLLTKYNVVMLFLASGPLLQSCSAAGAVVLGPIGLAGSTQLADLVVQRICEAVQVKFAIVNTIASRYVLPALARRYVPTVSLIHEFAAYIRPSTAFRDAVFWSGEVVFSTSITRRDAVLQCPEMQGRDYPIIPQGICIVPEDALLNGSVDRGEEATVEGLLRPKGLPAGTVVVVGAGYVDFRKGVDLFVKCAAHAIKHAPDVSWHFAWIGRGFNPDVDLAYSTYLADQVRRSSLEKHMSFLNEVSDLSAVYMSADIFVVSSRLDPLPNVAIDALSMGLPVVCFAETTGIADILLDHGLGDHAVASYLDTEAMAQKIIALARSSELRAYVGERSSQVARATFDTDCYLAHIEELAAQQEAHAEQERADVQVIASSHLPRLDFHLLPGQQDRSRESVVREYVRSWASGIGRRKLIPGFHPGVYREQHGLKNHRADPLADFLRAGLPQGPWSCQVIGPMDRWKPLPSSVRVALHIHAYHLDVVPQILSRLLSNSVRPDLLISVKSQSAYDEVQRQLEGYKEGKVEIRLVPDPGRDVGPFFTEFGQTLISRYDLIGHVHTKTSADLADNSVAKIWVRFLLENVLGASHGPMADIILGRMVEQPDIGMVFPDDPHVIGWDKNKEFVLPYASAFGLTEFPENLHFPVGAMFWARPAALKTMFDLNLGWDDYPAEPLPYDGSLLHGLERLYGLSVNQAGFRIANTNIPGLTR